jgi:hypothetical protein
VAVTAREQLLVSSAAGAQVVDPDIGLGEQGLDDRELQHGPG